MLRLWLRRQGAMGLCCEKSVKGVYTEKSQQADHAVMTGLRVASLQFEKEIGSFAYKGYLCK